MLEIATTLQFCSLQPTSVALGFFDGIHLGHAAVISRAVSGAGQALRPAVFTFTVQGGDGSKKSGQGRIITEQRKHQLLQQLGVQLVLTPDFSEFRGMSPRRFVQQVLCQQLQARRVCCGFDFHFGKNGAGNVDTLGALCAEMGVELSVVGEVRLGGEEISSTSIRRLIAAGQVSRAAQMLGHPYQVQGTVQRGNQLGRTMQFPTINLPIDPQMVLPRFGVYLSRVYLTGGRYWGITNVGVKPTVGSALPLAETNILGFSGDLYGQPATVELLDFLRPEQKFSSVQALYDQVQKDVQTARRTFAGRQP